MLTVGASRNQPEASGIHFRWLGVAGIELTWGGETLVIDPFFTRPSFWHLWFGRVEPNHALIAAQIKCCDTILVSHAHYDHMMDVPDIARNTGAVVLGSENSCAILRACAVPEQQIRGIHAGESLSLGSFMVEVSSTKHGWTPGFQPGTVRQGLQPPLRLRDYVMDFDYSFLVKLPGLRLLDWCGIGVEPETQADVLFMLPYSIRGYCQGIISRVKPRLIIPVHWDDFLHPLSQPSRVTYEVPRWELPPLKLINLDCFIATVQRIAPGTKVFVPEVLKTYELGSLL